MRCSQKRAHRYNRSVKTRVFCIAGLLFLAGCAKNIDTPEAVKQGIIADLSKKIDIQNMDVNVDSVSFREKDADATVSFRAKGTDPSQSMTMNYVLERQGDQWKIKSRTLESHGQSGTELPPGHPAVNGNGQLPPGHPAIPDSKKQ